MKNRNAILIVILIFYKIFLWYTIIPFNFLNKGFATASEPVSVSVIHSRETYNPGEKYPIVFSISISDGLYLHGPVTDGFMIPTEVSVKTNNNEIKITNIKLPQPERKRFKFLDEATEVYQNEFIIYSTLDIDANAIEGTFELAGEFRYQACTDVACLPPASIFFPVEIKIADGHSLYINNAIFGEEASIKSSIFDFIKRSTDFNALSLTAILIAVFLGGLALNLTPCIYPLIPITVSYFGGRGQDFKGKALVHGLLYILGIAVTNSTLGVIVSLSASSLFGVMLQSPVVIIFIAVLLLTMAASFFGVWEIKIPYFISSKAYKNYSGILNTFFMGLTLGILAAPCLGPFILGLLAWVGQKGNPFMGFLVFFVLSIGMGLPLVMLAVFSVSLSKLPISDNWLLWIKKAFGWVMVIMAVFMISYIIPGQLAKAAAIGLSIIGAGIHLTALDRTNGPSWFFFVKKIIFMISLLIGVSIVIFTYQSTDTAEWTVYDQKLLHEAASLNRPVIVDFYADWCIPCRQMDVTVFNDREVSKELKRFLMLRVDLTRFSEKNDEIRKFYEVKGVPTILFFDSKGIQMELLRIDSYVNKNVMLKKLFVIE